MTQRQRRSDKIFTFMKPLLFSCSTEWDVTHTRAGCESVIVHIRTYVCVSGYISRMRPNLFFFSSQFNSDSAPSLWSRSNFHINQLRSFVPRSVWLDGLPKTSAAQTLEIIHNRRFAPVKNILRSGLIQTQFGSGATSNLIRSQVGRTGKIIIITYQ